MNQLTEENVQNMKCSQKGTNIKNKSKKAKDPSENPDEISISNQENLSDTLANTLHINNINSNLTNGMSDHPNGSPEGPKDKSETREDATSGDVQDVNSVQCSDGMCKRECKDAPAQHTGRCIYDDALESLDNAISHEEHEPQDEIEIISYESELQMPEIMRLIQKDLSEPYSIYTYRYFIHNWPKLCFLATHEGKCIGAIVCKLDMHRNVVKRGYIAMLAVDEKYRKRKIGSRLVRKAIQAMINDNADEVVLETEITNKPALKLYENLGFVRDKRLFRYYLNGVDALRLKLWLR
nr:N-alpha-acetyltransferase 30 [Helicoverpa armigera]